MPDLEETLDLPVEADTPQQGLAAIAASIKADDTAEFQRRLDASGLRASSARGFLGDIGQILACLRGRREVEDLGTHTVRLDWLGFHVPQGGAGTLTLKATTEGKSSVHLKFMGFGGGMRRDITLSAERDFGAREQCFYLGVSVEVHLRTFAEGGSTEANVLQIDVERLLGSYLRPEPVCPLCFATQDRKPRRARPTGRGWDLAADEKGITETISYELSEAMELEVGLDIPLLHSTLKPAVTMNRVVKSVCSASYKFPGRGHFTGYQMTGKPLDLPFWGSG
jgi:hypothetical protein